MKQSYLENIRRLQVKWTLDNWGCVKSKGVTLETISYIINKEI